MGLVDILAILFGIGFIHKGLVERSILITSERLTPPDVRTGLGNTFRAKTRSLSWLMMFLGVIFFIRGLPFFEEPAWFLIATRLVALGLFVWNQYWCYRMRSALREELKKALDIQFVKQQDAGHGDIYKTYVAGASESGPLAGHDQGERQDHSG